jgi:hypothetical protein
MVWRGEGNLGNDHPERLSPYNGETQDFSTMAATMEPFNHPH